MRKVGRRCREASAAPPRLGVRLFGVRHGCPKRARKPLSVARAHSQAHTHSQAELKAACKKDRTLARTPEEASPYLA